MKELFDNIRMLDGGKGSGNFGHKGRPGKRGGSGKGITKILNDKQMRAVWEEYCKRVNDIGENDNNGFAYGWISEKGWQADGKKIGELLNKIIETNEGLFKDDNAVDECEKLYNEAIQNNDKKTAEKLKKMLRFNMTIEAMHDVALDMYGEEIKEAKEEIKEENKVEGQNKIAEPSNKKINAIDITNDSDLFDKDGKLGITFNDLNLPNYDIKAKITDACDFDKNRQQRFNNILQLNKSDFINFLNSQSELNNSYKNNFDNYEKELAEKDSDLSFYLDYPSLIDEDNKKKIFAVAWGNYNLDNVYSEGMELNEKNSNIIYRRDKHLINDDLNKYIAEAFTFSNDKDILQKQLKDILEKDGIGFQLNKYSYNEQSAKRLAENFYKMLNNRVYSKNNKKCLSLTDYNNFMSECFNDFGKRLSDYPIYDINDFITLSRAFRYFTEAENEQLNEMEQKDLLKDIIMHLDDNVYLNKKYGNPFEDVDIFDNIGVLDVEVNTTNVVLPLQSYQMLLCSAMSEFLPNYREPIQTAILENGYSFEDIFKRDFSDKEIKNIVYSLSDISPLSFVSGSNTNLSSAIYAAAIRGYSDLGINLDKYTDEQKMDYCRKIIEAFQGNEDLFKQLKNDGILLQDKMNNNNFYKGLQFSKNNIEINDMQATLITSLCNTYDGSAADVLRNIRKGNEGIANWDNVFSTLNDIVDSPEKVKDLISELSTNIINKGIDDVLLNQKISFNETLNEGIISRYLTQELVNSGKDISKMSKNALMNYFNTINKYLFDNINNLNGSNKDVTFMSNQNIGKNRKIVNNMAAITEDVKLSGDLVKTDTKDLDTFIDNTFNIADVSPREFNFFKLPNTLYNNLTLSSQFKQILNTTLAEYGDNVNNTIQWGLSNIGEGFHPKAKNEKEFNEELKKHCEDFIQRKNDGLDTMVFDSRDKANTLAAMYILEGIKNNASLYVKNFKKDFNAEQMFNDIKRVVGDTKETREINNNGKQTTKEFENRALKQNRILEKYQKAKNKPDVKSNFLDTTVIKDYDISKNKWTEDEAIDFINKLIPTLNLKKGSFERLAMEHDVKNIMAKNPVNPDYTKGFENTNKTNSNYASMKQNTHEKLTAEPVVEKEYSKIKQKRLYTFDDLRAICDLVTTSGYHYTSALQEDNEGMGSFVRMICASSPIYEGDFVRCENISDSFREYSNLKEGDTIMMNAQHFTYDPKSFIKSANNMFGKTGFRIKGKVPFLNLMPYVRKEKGMEEWEGLIAGCFKIKKIHKGYSLYGANFETMYDLEFDWDKWKSYIHANAKVFANQIGLYDRNSKMKAVDFLGRLLKLRILAEKRNRYELLRDLQLQYVFRKKISLDAHPKGRLSDEEYLKRYGHPRPNEEDKNERNSLFESVIKNNNIEKNNSNIEENNSSIGENNNIDFSGTGLSDGCKKVQIVNNIVPYAMRKKIPSTKSDKQIDETKGKYCMQTDNFAVYVKKDIASKVKQDKIEFLLKTLEQNYIDFCNIYGINDKAENVNKLSKRWAQSKINIVITDTPYKENVAGWVNTNKVKMPHFGITYVENWMNNKTVILHEFFHAYNAMNKALGKRVGKNIGYMEEFMASSVSAVFNFSYFSKDNLLSKITSSGGEYFMGEHFNKWLMKYRKEKNFRFIQGYLENMGKSIPAQVIFKTVKAHTTLKVKTIEDVMELFLKETCDDNITRQDDRFKKLIEILKKG